MHHSKSSSLPPPQSQKHHHQQKHHQQQQFQTLKLNCLSKRDKSSAGRIDPRAVDICAVINARREYYTTSSCSGRCFLYCGDGIKSWHQALHDSKSTTTTTTDVNTSISGATSGTTGSDIVGVSEVGKSGNSSDCIDDDDDDAGNNNNNNNNKNNKNNNNTHPIEPTTSPPMNNKLGFFKRYRVNHDFIHEPQRYFDLTTLFDGSDPTGGGDPIPTIGQFDHGNNASFKSKLDDNTINTNDKSSSSSTTISSSTTTTTTTTTTGTSAGSTQQPSSPIWLRFEPFILHVMCHSLKSASVLMAAARPAFKNVGLTSWHCDDIDNDEAGDGTLHYEEHGDTPCNNYNVVMEEDDNDIQQQQQQQCKKGKCPRYLVAIWGDEGLDLPLSLPMSPTRGLYYHPDTGSNVCNSSNAKWLASLVNERHARNWKKIERFVDSVKSLEDERIPSVDDHYDDDEDDIAVSSGLDGLEMDKESHGLYSTGEESGRVIIPRSYDGEKTMMNAAFSYGMECTFSNFDLNNSLFNQLQVVVGDVAILNSLPQGNEEMQRRVGELIMSRNKAIKICVARTDPLSTSDRSPGSSGMIQLAGLPRNPIVTSHYEYGVKCVVDIQQTFFSPRMAPERLRLSQQVARGERVLVVFAGVGMEALQIVSKTEAKEVLAIEKNGVAAECLRRARRMLERNKTVTTPGGGVGAAERLTILEGDALELLPTLECASFDRIVAPRPKEGATDGDMGTGDAGKPFLLAMLPSLKLKGEVHWYDFAADHELPYCNRTREMVKAVCHSLGLEMEVIHVAKVGSVAKRQFRVCMDFRVTGRVAPTAG